MMFTSKTKKSLRWWAFDTAYVAFCTSIALSPLIIWPSEHTGNTRIAVVESSVRGISYIPQYEVTDRLFGIRSEWENLHVPVLGCSSLQQLVEGKEKELECAKKTIDDYLSKFQETTTTTYIKYP